MRDGNVGAILTEWRNVFKASVSIVGGRIGFLDYMIDYVCGIWIY